MKNILQHIPSSIVIAVLGWLLVFGGHGGSIKPPRIETRYDTVQVIDTQWVTKLKHDTVYKDKIVERIVTEKPETLKIFVPVAGVTALSVPNKVGDSTLVFGFRIKPDTVGFIRTQWEYQYWTPGPIKSLTLTSNGVPSVDFYKPPSTCNLKCKVKIGSGAIIVFEIVRSVMGNP